MDDRPRQGPGRSGRHRRVHPRRATEGDWDGDVTYQAVHTRFLRPDVAAVKVRQVYHAPDGASEGTPLYIMTKQDDGAWLLHAGQNTLVRAD
ncbi:SgcJ/EcaC family oxidoreductase [Actinomadura geliboluensis]|uniref:SgcJ/EcaC family oxidoreductase n=1 Tax=Actinomadura geliboluensis TaxID=882440 RepID=UPI0030B8100F